METLIVYQVKTCLQGCDLIKALQIIKDIDSTIESMQKAGLSTSGAVSSVEGMDGATLNMKMLKLNEALASLDPTHLNRIDDSNLRKKARAMVSNELYEAYKMIYEGLLKDGGYVEYINNWYNLEKVKVVLS